VPPSLRVAIDLRPLARGPATGIGLILTQILEEVPSRGCTFVGVSDRPLPEGLVPESVEVRATGLASGRIRWEASVLPRLLRSLDPPPDLFHATWNHGIPSGLSFPSVLSLHDLIPWVLPEAVPWPRPKALHRWLYRRSVRGSARRAAEVVTLSDASRRDIVARLPGLERKITVIPCAVPRWFWAAPDPRAIESWRARVCGRPYWLYFGGFDPRKGLDLLVRALARAFPDRARAPLLVLAGARNALAERLAAEAAAEGLPVELPGYVPDPELRPLLAGASLFVYPSRYEGFGIPPLLAMAAGVPCLASDAASLPEVVGDAALLFRAGDVEALTERMRDAASDPARMRELAARGPERAARFSVEALAERTRSVYERAASLRRGSA